MRRVLGAPVARVRAPGIFAFAVAVFFSTFFLSGPGVWAQSTALQKTFTYKAGRIDTKGSARIVAYETVKTRLTEEIASLAGPAVKEKGIELSREEIIALVRGTFPVQVVEEKWDGKSYLVSGRLEAEAVRVVAAVEMLSKDLQVRKELEKARRRGAELFGEASKIRNDVEASKPQKKKADGAAVARKTRQYSDIMGKLSGIDWFERGFAYQQAGKDQEAIDAYGRALALIPNYAEVYFRRGTVSSKQGNTGRALNDFTSALELNPDYTSASLYRGAVQYKLKNYQAALADLNKVLGTIPEHGEALVIRGATYHRLKNFRAAIEDFTKVIKANPSYREAYVMIGGAYFGAGELDKAVAMQTRAIELDPGNPSGYVERGTSHYYMKNYGPAIEDLDRAIELNPRYGEAFAIRGATYGSMGEYEKANEDLKSAARLGDKEAQAFLTARGIAWE